MKNYRNITKSFILICALLIIADLIFKSLIPQGIYKTILGGFITLAKTKTIKLSLGISYGYSTSFFVKLFFQFLLLLLFFRIQRLEIQRLFKYTTTLIVFGWIGNYIDMLIWANGDINYQHLDYFQLMSYGNFTNISTAMVTSGWFLLLIAVIIGFRDLKFIFGKGHLEK